MTNTNQMNQVAETTTVQTVPFSGQPRPQEFAYKDRIVRLVDGGVTDNQGVATLLEQDCKVMLVSDASGQMESQLAVGRGILGYYSEQTTSFRHAFGPPNTTT